MVMPPTLPHAIAIGVMFPCGEDAGNDVKHAETVTTLV